MAPVASEQQQPDDVFALDGHGIRCRLISLDFYHSGRHPDAGPCPGNLRPGDVAIQRLRTRIGYPVFTDQSGYEPGVAGSEQVTTVTASDPVSQRSLSLRHQLLADHQTHNEHRQIGPAKRIGSGPAVGWRRPLVHHHRGRAVVIPVALGAAAGAGPTSATLAARRLGIRPFPMPDLLCPPVAMF